MPESSKMRFSVIVPSFNTGDVIRQTIDSILQQQFADYEVIVVDDGSSDNTVDILKAYGNRIALIRQNHAGSTTARNVGLQLAKGEYIVNFDHDDILYPHALGLYDQVIEQYKNPPLLISTQRYFSGKGECPRPSVELNKIDCSVFGSFFTKNLPLGITNSCIIVDRARMMRVGGYQNESFCFDDRTLLFKLGVEGPFIVINGPVAVAYRVHDTNASQDLKYMMEGVLALIARERRGDFPGGKKRAFDRRALIGTNVLSNIRRSFLRSERYGRWRRFSMVLKIILSSREMLLLGPVRAVFCRFYSRKDESFALRVRSRIDQIPLREPGSALNQDVV
jgi:glycosyltransferase involved in cell wall biosynthesis